MAAFETQRYGAVVATIKDGEIAIEMKDCGNGTFDLTIFSGGEDMTAYALKMHDLIALRDTTINAIVRLENRNKTPRMD
jgi:hypothetical protein